MGLPKDILHDFNWTFTTEYKGTLKERIEDSFFYSTEPSFRVDADTAEKLNLEKLMVKEQILFYEELTLFEDELHDNGISNCSVKIVSEIIIYLVENVLISFNSIHPTESDAFWIFCLITILSKGGPCHG